MLVSSVSDLLKWDAALDSETLLTKSILERMWTTTPLSKGEPAGYGFGWEVGKVNGHRRVSHGGGIPGFSTNISRFVDDKLTVIVLTNSDQGNAGMLAQGIAQSNQPNLAKAPEAPIADTDPQTSERLKNVFLRGMKGGSRSRPLHGGGQKGTRPQDPASRQARPILRLWGAESVLVLAQGKRGRDTVARIAQAFENETAEATFSMDKNGKIAGLQLRPSED